MSNSYITNATAVSDTSFHGLWHYRTWSNGMAECWRSYGLQIAAKNLNMNTYIQFPFTFEYVPIRIVGLNAGGYQEYKAWCIPDHVAAYPNNEYIRIGFYNGYTSAVILYAHIYCFGYLLQS